MSRHPDDIDADLELLQEKWETAARNGEHPRLDDFLTLHCPGDPDVAGQFRQMMEDPNFNAHAFLLQEDNELTGQTVGRYVIKQRVGSGGMGEVFLAHDPELNRVVAVKFLRLRADPRRFKAEVQALARLNHPSIVQVYDGGTWDRDNRQYFIMEYVPAADGKRNLLEKIAGRPRDPWLSARLVMLLARVLRVAHDQGILHRDLKASNVLLAPAAQLPPELCTQWGCPKIVDFGLVKRLDEPHGMTSPGIAVGTLVYMAPEQLRGEPADFSTDVYGLGGILYELLAGHPAFRGSSIGEVTDRVQHASPPPLCQSLPGVPAELERICLKCLEKKPSDRYATAAALADDLAALLAVDHRTSAKGVTGQEREPARSNHRKPASPAPTRRRRTLVWMGLGAVAVVLAISVPAIIDGLLNRSKARSLGGAGRGSPVAESQPDNPSGNAPRADQPAHVASDENALSGLLTTGVPPDSAGPPPRLGLDVLKWDGVTRSLSELKDGDVLRSEIDQYVIVARPGTGGYLYLFQIDSGDRVNWFFPANVDGESAGQNPVAPGLAIHVPPAGSGRGLFLDENKGRERIFAVLCAAHWPALEDRLAEAVRRRQPVAAPHAGTRGAKGSRLLGTPATVQLFDTEIQLSGHEFQSEDSFLQAMRWFHHD